VRKRPLTRRELANSEQDIIAVAPPQTLTLREQKSKVDLTKYMEAHEFNFDAAYDEHTSNASMYEDLLRPLVASAFAGAKVTVFAYGQTGSGKTYTMLGDAGSGAPGMYLLAANDLFGLLQSPEFSGVALCVSFFEIYCDKTFDLLNERTHCPVRSDARENVHVVGLSERHVRDTEGLMALIAAGLAQRVTSTTGSNDDSSRSHAILQVTLRARSDGKMTGRMSFIDLAGSERGADVRDTNKQTLLDGTEINKSLLALKECIRALDLDAKHLPFRNSKLTQVLKESFIGNCRTVMIGNISPAASATEHTLNTLRYTDRVKELKRGGKEKGDVARQMFLPRSGKNSKAVEPLRRPAQELGGGWGRQADGVNKRVSMALGPGNDFRREKQFMAPEGTRPPANPFMQQANALKANPQLRVFEDTSNIARCQQPLLKQMKAQHEQPAPQLQQVEVTEQLLAQLAAKQDRLLEAHSEHIDRFVGFVKEDMRAIQGIKDTPAELLEYVQRSRQIISAKQASLDRFAAQLHDFEASLQALEGTCTLGSPEQLQMRW